MTVWTREPKGRRQLHIASPVMAATASAPQLLQVALNADPCFADTSVLKPTAGPTPLATAPPNGSSPCYQVAIVVVRLIYAAGLIALSRLIFCTTRTAVSKAK